MRQAVRWGALGLALLGLTGWGGARAEDGPSLTILSPIALTQDNASLEPYHLTLEKVLEQVQNQNLDVALGEAHILEAQGDVQQSVGFLLPSVRYYQSAERFKGGEIIFTGTPVLLDRTTHAPRVSVDYQIPLGGRTIFHLRASKFELARAMHEKDRLFQKALQDAVLVYYTVLRDHAHVASATQSLAEADTQLHVTESQLRAGVITKLDVMESKTLQAERSSLLLSAENQEAVSLVQLASMLNISFLTPLSLEAPEMVPCMFLDPETPLETLYAAAQENRPDLKELTAKLETAKAQLAEARSQLFPTLTLSAYERGIGPQLNELRTTKQAFAAISIDVLRNMGLPALGDIKSNRARVNEALINQQKQLSEIQKNLSKAYLDFQLAKGQLAAGREKLDSSQEAFRIAQARYKFGVGINLEIVQAQTKLTEARLDYQSAVMNYNTSQVRLLYETGQLTPDRIRQGAKTLAALP